MGLSARTKNKFGPSPSPPQRTPFLNFKIKAGTPIFRLVAQTLHHLCRATAVALHWCRIFRLMFSQCHTRIALHPLRLKVSQTRPCRTFCWGGGRALSWPCIYHKIMSRYRGVAATVSRVALVCDTKQVFCLGLLLLVAACG